jgi:hypothetical protein
MRAGQHTAAMLRFWAQAGITHADVAIRRPRGTMIYHYQRPLDRLPLAWLRAENVRRAEVYIRPARGQAWPLLFLDDVDVAVAQRIAGKYAALVVHTSPRGGCHLWLCLACALAERQRYQAQHWLASLIGADLGSISGEHLGRLGGTRNWKRHGVWVNVLNPQPPPRAPWDPAAALHSPLPSRDAKPRGVGAVPSAGAIDTSPSGKEWGWVCGAIAAGVDLDSVYRQLLQRASLRRGKDAQRYARYTIDRARRHLL